MKKKPKFYYCTVCDKYIEDKGTRIITHPCKEIAPVTKNNNHKTGNNK